MGAVIALTSKKEEEASENSVATTSQPQQVAQESEATSPSVSSATYKDGTYTATGTYNTPEGQESIDVSVTISGNTVSDAAVTSKAKARESKTYQSAFISGFKQQVVGKNVDDISLSKVSGSSLTPRGFNDALDEIRSEARG